MVTLDYWYNGPVGVGNSLCEVSPVVIVMRFFEQRLSTDYSGGQ